MSSPELWSVSLDALEEWVRRFATDIPTEAAPELPTGPVPASLRLRALALQAEMQQTVTDGRALLHQLGQQQAYAQV